MARGDNYRQPIKGGGPLLPFNERQRLKLLVSEELKKQRGIGSSKDRVERSLERSALKDA